MKKSKDSLFDITSKTLDESQIADVVARFKEAVERFTKMPQVELVDESKDFKHLKLRFISLSEAGNFNIPSIVLEERETCKNMETVRFIEINAYNCGTCQGGSTAKFDAKNIRKITQVLVNLQALFEKNYHEAMKNDKKEVEFNKVVENAKSLVFYHEKTIEKKRTYKPYEKYTTSATMLGNVEGHLYENRDKQDFRIELKHLNLQQLEKLSQVITNL